RDAYDSQEVLDSINKLLTRDIDLDPITSRSLRVICQQLKVRRGMFITVEKNHIFHTAVFQQQPHEIGLAELRNFNKTVTVASDLLGGHSKQILEKYGYEAALRLSTQDGVFGYILLSEKQSGNIFVNQDIRLLSLIASELAVGVQNAMAVEDIRQFNVTLRQKIEEATKELRQANSKLKELDQTKDEFISMASHQLRTPLTTIKGYLSMVLEGDAGPVGKDERQMIQQAFDSSERMVFLIADLLNVSRLQSGKFVIENKPTDLVKLVQTEVNQLKETAGHHQLKLTCSTPDKLPLFNLDETKIRQVVMNFLDNAIYYTPAGGSISVALEATSHTINYTVTDTGLGVPKQEQHHLFSKFYRAGNARKMRPDGTGLGLFMAKKVITAQGGAIIFKSEEGKGSTFGFSFPRGKLEIKNGTAQ
ncbi:MAG TPA: HAMP domain-containing sensor histidine kinase, partial [Candidatus Saccharimonadales bacterium]|nr:HAMP domain-containing sensor histidine kinase [Candidatus Saccharimonadales bacterium]